MCGEAAGDPLLALALVGLGVTSLSMASLALPQVWGLLAATAFTDCEEIASAVARQRTALD